jgi:hypothetical protein
LKWRFSEGTPARDGHFPNSTPAYYAFNPFALRFFEVFCYRHTSCVGCAKQHATRTANDATTHREKKESYRAPAAQGTVTAYHYKIITSRALSSISTGQIQTL